MPRDSRPSVEVLESIRQKARSVRIAASDLTRRIDAFVEYLSEMPGRTEACVYGEHPDGSGNQFHQSLMLQFQREKSGWGLRYGTFVEGFNDDPENPVDVKPIGDAPLRYKLAIVKLFPDLLEAIEREQSTMVKTLEKATSDLDAFLATLTTTAKEAK